MFVFKDFTEKANRALNLAIETAEKLGHTYIGSEHMLYGLSALNDGVAAELLKAGGVNAEDIYEKLVSTIGKGIQGELSPNDFTPRSKRILETAVYIARQLGHSYVGTEHILMAIIKESDSYGVMFLSELGAHPEQIYNECLSQISNEPADAFENEGTTGSGFSGGKASDSLNKYGRCLTELAKSGKIDPVIGREKEIERVIQILSRRTKNNPCLIGEPGVGKTAIAEGLAQKIVSGELPETLKNKKIFSLDISSMLAGAKYRGDFEERIKDILSEVAKSGDTILFIDEIHTIVGAGAAEGAVDAANILKPQLARGEIQIIGATTIDEYRKYIEKDAALERRFQPVTVSEPSEEDAEKILFGLRDKYEAHHKVKISDAAIKAAVNLSARYIADRYLPDKAIDLIDEAASKVRLAAYTAPPDIKKLEAKLKRLSEEKASAVNVQDFEAAAKIRNEEKELSSKLDEEKKRWQEQNAHANGEVTEENIADIVSDWTGVPVRQLNEQESERLLNLETTLHERVIGQDEAVSAVAKAVRRGRTGLKDPKRPIGSFIFCGPTGVGKTELCKSLAQSLFGDENAMIRLDMSEYMEKHSVSKMIGSPPGYVGFEEGGQLTERLRRHPYSVVLFDEIEKAHPDVFNMLLQILEDGVITDSQGRHINCKNTVIIMTSNIGARLITEKKSNLGFGSGDNKAASNEDIKQSVLSELKKSFKPEFLNRVDDIIVFKKLTEGDIERIAENMLKTLCERTKQMDITVNVSPDAVKKIAKAGYDEVYGARPLRRAITAQIEDLLSELMLENQITEGDTVTLNVKDDKFVFDKQ